MMWLVSFGATLTMESVHILCCSIVAIIAGPTKCRINSGRALVSRRAQHSPRDRHQQRCRNIRQLPLKDRRILILEKTKQRQPGRLPPRIDDVVRPRQQLIHMVGVGARRLIPAQYREVRRHLPVEQRHLLQLSARKLLNPCWSDAAQQERQPVPVRPPLGNPLIR